MSPIAAAALAALFTIPIGGWFIACERLRRERQHRREGEQHQ